MIAVKIVCDVPRRAARGVFREDARDDRGLVRHDDALARCSQSRSVGVGEAATGKPLANTARLAAPHLMSIVLSVELADEASKADEDGVDRALVHGSELDAEQ